MCFCQLPAAIKILEMHFLTEFPPILICDFALARSFPSRNTIPRKHGVRVAIYRGSGSTRRRLILTITRSTSRWPFSGTRSSGSAAFFFIVIVIVLHTSSKPGRVSIPCKPRNNVTSPVCECVPRSGVRALLQKWDSWRRGLTQGIGQTIRVRFYSREGRSSFQLHSSLRWKEMTERKGSPFCSAAGRWIGGTLTVGTDDVRLVNSMSSSPEKTEHNKIVNLFLTEL